MLRRNAYASSLLLITCCPGEVSVSGLSTKVQARSGRQLAYPAPLRGRALPLLQAACSAQCIVKSSTSERPDIGGVVAHQFRVAGLPSKNSDKKNFDAITPCVINSRTKGVQVPLTSSNRAPSAPVVRNTHSPKSRASSIVTRLGRQCW